MAARFAVARRFFQCGKVGEVCNLAWASAARRRDAHSLRINNAISAIPPPVPFLPREVANLAYFVAAPLPVVSVGPVNPGPPAAT